MLTADELTSPLSSLPSSRESSSDSYHTANASNVHLRGSTAASSPTWGLPSLYRKAIPLPRELKDNCQIHLEEQLYAIAIPLLNSTLTSSLSTRTGPSVPAYVPPPTHLAVINTLLVHPLHTTRADKVNSLDVPSLALDYLRNLVDVVGPVNARLCEAFQFVPGSGRRLRHRLKKTSTGQGDDAEIDDEVHDHGRDAVRGKIANEASIWSREQDFWRVVGWAFNCSAKYPRRWRYWRLWLEYMIDILDADWAERERMDEDAEGESSTTTTGNENTPSFISQSLLVSYVTPQIGHREGMKRIINSLFADGNRLSLSTFSEVFRNENKEGPEDGDRKRKRDGGIARVDLENDRFGDYYVEDESTSSSSSGLSEPSTPPEKAAAAAVQGKTAKASNARSATEEGERERGRERERERGFSAAHQAEAVTLRLRLFKLVSRAYHHLGNSELVSEVYTAFADSAATLPLPLFTQLISYPTSPLLGESQVTILKTLFSRLVSASSAGSSSSSSSSSSNSSSPEVVDPEANAVGALSMAMLEKCFLPCAAASNSVDENARVSLLVENSLLLSWGEGELEGASEEDMDAILEAAEQGMSARAKKATALNRKKRGGRGGDPVDKSARRALEASTTRMRVLVKVLASI